MWVLIMYQAGDYGDYYERPATMVAVSEDDAPLHEFWDQLPVVGTNGDDPIKSFEDTEYVGHAVELVPHINETE